MIALPGEQGQQVHVRLVMIPSFGDTGEIVLLDLDSLDCKVVSFDQSTAPGWEHDDESSVAPAVPDAAALDDAAPMEH